MKEQIKKEPQKHVCYNTKYIPTGLDILNMILATQIENLCNTSKGCTAGNDYFANILGLGDKSITDRITYLTKEGFIECEFKNTKTGTKRTIIWLNRNLSIPLNNKRIRIIPTPPTGVSGGTPTGVSGRNNKKLNQIPLVEDITTIKTNEPTTPTGGVINDKEPKAITNIIDDPTTTEVGEQNGPEEPVKIEIPISIPVAGPKETKNDNINKVFSPLTSHGENLIESKKPEEMKEEVNIPISGSPVAGPKETIKEDTSNSIPEFLRKGIMGPDGKMYYPFKLTMIQGQQSMAEAERTRNIGKELIKAINKQMKAEQKIYMANKDIIIRNNPSHKDDLESLDELVLIEYLNTLKLSIPLKKIIRRNTEAVKRYSNEKKYYEQAIKNINLAHTCGR